MWCLDDVVRFVENLLEQKFQQACDLQAFQTQDYERTKQISDHFANEQPEWNLGQISLKLSNEHHSRANRRTELQEAIK